MKKNIFKALFIGALAAGLLMGCSNNNGGNDTTTASNDDVKNEIIKIGASPSPHAEILEEAAKLLADNGYTLDIVEFSDYVQPNLALDSGELDANFFQHLPYLETFSNERNLKLVSAATIHYEPLGVYPGKTASFEELEDGASIAVPNDPTNEARALLLLESQGLIKLREGAGVDATVLDIIENEKNLDIIEIEAVQLPMTLPDVDLAVINGNYAISAGLGIDDAIAIEDLQSVGATTYGNVIAVQEGNEESAAILALIEALKSDEVTSFIEAKYEGSVVPLN